MSIGQVLGIICIHTVLVSNIIHVDAVISTLSDLDNEVANLVDEYFDKQDTVPVQTVGSVISVTVDFDLVSVIGFEDDSSYVTLAGYLTVVWTEERYTTVTDNIDVSVPASSIWTPPLSIVNSLSSASLIGSDDDVVKFNLNTARLEWKPWIYTKVACDSNSFFPFDEHVCSLKITSLTLDNSDMTLSVADNTVGMASFEENNQWKLKSTSVTSYTVDSFPYVVYKLTTQRRSQFLTFILVGPIFVLSIMHFLVFLIPQQANEKSNYCVMNTIAVLLTLLWAMTYIPISVTPLSSVVFYLFTEFVLNVAVVVVALVLANNFHRCVCCTDGSCFESLVSERKPDKFSKKDAVSNVTENAPISPSAVRMASVATAWDDDVFTENLDTPESASENKTDGKVRLCNRSSVFIFVFFLTLHFCFTVAFFVSLGLNIE